MADEYVEQGTPVAGIQTAIDNLGAGGTLEFQPGIYNLTSGLSITANKRIRLLGYGAIFQLPAGVTGITVSQGNTTTRGVEIEGLRIDGQGNASTIGILLQDTNNATLVGCEIDNCTVGIQLTANAAGGYVEGSRLDDCLIRGCGTGLAFTKVNATNASFGQTVIHGLRVSGMAAAGTGISIGTGCIFYRCWLQGTVWIDSNMTGMVIDGDVTNSTIILGVEGSTGSTGNTALSCTANALHLDLAAIHLLQTGTINTPISNTPAFAFNYYPNANEESLVGMTGSAIVSYKRTGDSVGRLVLEQLNNGGRISFGPGNGVVDANIARSGIGQLTSTAHFMPADLKLHTKAGAPVDGDVPNGVADGDIIVDTTNNKIWVRILGGWKGVAVA